MDVATKAGRSHPRAHANPISALFFWWTAKVFYTGYRQDLGVSDLYDPLKDHKSSIIGNKLEKLWKDQLKRKQPKLLGAITRLFGREYVFYGLVTLIVECVVKVAQPIFLGGLIRYFSPGSTMTLNEAYAHAGGVIACSGLALILTHPSQFGVMHLGMRIRVGICSLIYRKSLRLNHGYMGQTTAGRAVNLISNDVNRFDSVPMFLHYLWVGPIQLGIICYLMWGQMQESAMIGVAVILIMIPLQGFFGKSISKYRMKTALRTDNRVRLMTEIISGIQVIKMYTWEKPFAEMVSLARRMEAKQILRASYVRGALMSFVMFTTRTTLYVSVVSYVLLGNTITAEKVFVMTSFYNVLRQSMAIFFPQAIGQLAEGIVSVRRLQEFLLMEETTLIKKEDASNKVDGVLITHDESKPHDPLGGGVKVNQGTAVWAQDQTALDQVDLELRPGHLVAVIGPVGAGKSSLIHAVLGELTLSSGSIHITGDISYASQEPWLFTGSVRQNITFGQPWDEKRYNKVVRVCALERDFTELPYADQTIVGERGVSLSGGQRARVSLARAVYKEADIYLLDDPLSAVDAHVGRHLFDDCIKGYLRKKAVFLVTHQLQYLTQANQILILNNGHVEARGTYTELQNSGLDFAKLLASEDEESGLEEDDPTSETDSNISGLIRRISSKKRKVSKDISDTETMKAPEQTAEMRTSGSVSGQVYGQYLRAGGNMCVVVCVFSLFFIAQMAGSGADYWVSFWTNWEEMNNNPVITFLSDVIGWRISLSLLTEAKDSSSWMTTDIAIYIYSGLIVSLIVISLIRAMFFYAMCMRASINLHDSMFAAITRTTMAFFNNNPSGRILNRFSKDMGQVDELLPSAMTDTLQISMTLLGIVVVVSIANYWLLIPTVLMGGLFYILRIIYLATSRSVKRLEGVTRSPVFTHLNASIQGLTTIRAYGAQDVLITQFDEHQDLHSSAWYMYIATSRSFAMLLDFMCFIYIAIVTLSFLVMDTDTNGANVGLAITQSIGLTGIFQWGMRQSAELENQMTSVERILEFSKLESESALETSAENRPEEGWPRSGKVAFDKLALRYSPADPPVLKNISFTINAGEKVGIVGRTGAGKSSLISALFRLADCSGGRILIDEVDTAKLGLHQLRANISIIPQEPVLFSGTMRKNLDPFDHYSDQDLWSALEEVELKTAVAELPGGLNAQMSDGGSNFSVGQRQLVCLARAIVRNNRILVLDEATANVDPKTDSLIQSTIRRKFAPYTVLTIAHRLHTIMDSDRVLVMDAGNVAEFDSPARLISNSDSMFNRMAKQTGEAAFLSLQNRANDSSVVNNNPRGLLSSDSSFESSTKM